MQQQAVVMLPAAGAGAALCPAVQAADPAVKPRSTTRRKCSAVKAADAEAAGQQDTMPEESPAPKRRRTVRQAVQPTDGGSAPPQATDAGETAGQQDAAPKESPAPKRRRTTKQAAQPTDGGSAPPQAASLPVLGPPRAEPGYVTERLLWLCERSLGAEYDSRTALRALELLGKQWGMFNDKAEAAPPDLGVLHAVLAQLQSLPTGADL